MVVIAKLCLQGKLKWVSDVRKTFSFLVIEIKETFLATESTNQKVVIAKLRIQRKLQGVSDVSKTFSFFASGMARNVCSN